MTAARPSVVAALFVASCNLPTRHPAPTPLADASHAVVTFESGNTVANMSVGGDVVIPTSCDPVPTGPLDALCTPAFRHLAHDRGTRGSRLIDTRSTEASTYYAFAAVVEGSGECGAYGFWIMRVDKRIHITQPLEGCFAFSEDAEKSPSVQWGPPVRLVVRDERPGSPPRTFVLHEPEGRAPTLDRL